MTLATGSRTFSVIGLVTESDVKKLEDGLLNISGVDTVDIDTFSQNVTVIVDDSVTFEELQSAALTVGFELSRE